MRVQSFFLNRVGGWNTLTRRVGSFDLRGAGSRIFVYSGGRRGRRGPRGRGRSRRGDTRWRRSRSRPRGKRSAGVLRNAGGGDEIGGTSEPGTEGVAICPSTGEDEEQSDESVAQVWANIRPIQTVSSNSWQNVPIRTARGRGNAVRVVAPGTGVYRSQTRVALRSKMLNSPIALTGQRSKRTNIVTPTFPVVPAPFETRGRFGENLGENNEGEEQIHSPKCGGSHLVQL